MSRDVFLTPSREEHSKDQEWLSLWVPFPSDLRKHFSPEICSKIVQTSATDFKFSGKKFKFLLSQDNEIFAKTNNGLWSFNDFIEKYSGFEFEEFASKSANPESFSYSQMYVENAEYH